VTDCTFRANVADDDGAGIYTRGGTIAVCVIVSNRTVDTYAHGGGVYAESVAVRDCTVRGNSMGEDGYGAGVNLNHGSIEDCTITGNFVVSGGRGGGVYAAPGLVSNCVIEDNDAGVEGNGGGVYAEEATVVNCLIRRNAVADDGYGGGVYAYDAFLRNCTVVENSGGTDAAGGGVYSECETAFDNTIIWSNTAPAGSNWYSDDSYDSFAYSCTAPTGGLPNAIGCIADNPWGPHAIGDCRLLYASPCIDAGQDLTVEGVTHDLVGTARPIDGNFDGTNAFDIGAYEYNPANADTDGDGVSDGDEMTVHYSNPTNTNTDGDPMDDGEEVIAYTDLTNAASYFQITAISSLPPITVHFTASTNRKYSLQSASNLVDGSWSMVDGQSNVVGGGATHFLKDTNPVPASRFYRVGVDLR